MTLTNSCRGGFAQAGLFKPPNGRAGAWPIWRFNLAARSQAVSFLSNYSLRSPHPPFGHPLPEGEGVWVSPCRRLSGWC